MRASGHEQSELVGEDGVVTAVCIALTPPPSLVLSSASLAGSLAISVLLSLKYRKYEKRHCAPQNVLQNG